MKRIAVFADVQNLYYTVRQAYGCHFNYAALWADISQRGEIVEAYAYAIREDCQKMLSTDPWDFDRFLQNGLEKYIHWFVEDRRDLFDRGDL